MSRVRCANYRILKFLCRFKAIYIKCELMPNHVTEKFQIHVKVRPWLGQDHVTDTPVSGQCCSKYSNLKFQGHFKVKIIIICCYFIHKIYLHRSYIHFWCMLVIIIAGLPPPFLPVWCIIWFNSIPAKFIFFTVLRTFNFPSLSMSVFLSILKLRNHIWKLCGTGTLTAEEII